MVEYMISQDLNIKCAVQGFVKIEATDYFTGETKIVADWFPNKILGFGLDSMKDKPVLDACYLYHGSDDSEEPKPPEWYESSEGPTWFTDEPTPWEYNGFKISEYNEHGPGAPYYYTSNFRSWRYEPHWGEVIDTSFDTILIGWSESRYNPVFDKDEYVFFKFSRFSIKDPSGNPMSIDVGPNTYLTVTYEIRLYPPLTDSNFVLNIGGVSHDVKVRASSVSTSVGNPGWGPNIGPVGFFQICWAYDGNFDSITEVPSGESSQGYTTQIDASVNRQMQADIFFDLDQGNFLTGIKSLLFYTHNMGVYQMQFTPSIPKDRYKTFTLRVFVSWTTYDGTYL